MSFLLGLLMLILFFGLFVFLIILSFFKSLFSFGRKRDANARSNNENRNKNYKRGKVFQKNEGEYVDYEEVKD